MAAELHAACWRGFTLRSRRKILARAIRMRVILVNRFFYPDESATSRMLSGLAFSLAHEGIEVTALCGCRPGDDESTLGKHTERGVEIVRLSSTKGERHGLIWRALNDLRFHLRTGLWLLRNVQSRDICVICTDPPLHSVSAAPAIVFRGGLMVNWAFDLFPDVAIELGVIQRRRVLARSMLFLRDLSLRSAARIVCPIGSMAERLVERGHPREKLIVIRLWSNGDEIAPVAANDNPLRQNWGYKDQLVIGHSGNFGRAHDFTTLIGAANLLKDDPRIQFLLVGNGVKRTEVEEQVRTLGLSNVSFQPLQPREKLSESMSVADAHVVSLFPELESCIVPSKFYGVLAAGRPTLFVGSREGEVARICADADCGVQVDIGDVNALTRQILRLRDDPGRRLAMGQRARNLFLSDYSRQRGMGEWRALLDDLAQPSSGEVSPGISAPQPGGVGK
ncbi:glycosyltransferase family 4 protein [Qingshengfaniella alkalisoli]|uniref:Glycosyltransferase family 4 protein n=1 Tax=Qingshengfaniella alkalisoli TaxID=2599296 RepID=A0A5B8J0S0_9RHOB|nr:glycosyltransferase family 4 protein [Qingshengfaniella alkalisoli]QDY70478.1 glycosyltransferase family 4 protein [Qingshengfaniella alkalisoli]